MCCGLFAILSVSLAVLRELFVVLLLVFSGVLFECGVLVAFCILRLLVLFQFSSFVVRP